MKLIIQIPCFNEEEALPTTLGELPREVEGFDTVEWQIIDDGSTDRTVEIARRLGVEHIVQLGKNLGLAHAFMAGLHAALKQDADVIVNTDADNQYCAADIPRLTEPILAGQAEIVIGSRPISEISHFSRPKKILQHFGSWVVRLASGTRIPDAPSGFRAISRDAALQLNVFNNYTYTLETIIQAGRKNIPIASVPIRVNPNLRQSRLFKSIFSYIKRSILIIVRIFVVYKPFRFFALIGGLLFSIGFLIGLRFLYYYFTAGGTGHVQSLILAAVLMAMGSQTVLIAFVADLIAVNRNLLEELQYRQRKIQNGHKTDF